MKIYLTRHGQTDWNVQRIIQGSVDTDLNETGYKQAQELGERLSHDELDIHKIYSSNKKRASETARAVSEILNVEMVSIEGIEEIHLGDWEGKTFEQIQQDNVKQYRYWYENRRYTQSPNGESYQQLMERFLPALVRIAKIHDEDVLVVSHGGVLMCLQCLIHDVPFELMTDFRVPNTELIAIDGNELITLYKRFLRTSLHLVKPSLHYLRSIKNYRSEAINANEVLHGASMLEDYEDISHWIHQVELDQYTETVREGYVPASTYILVRKSDEKVVGMINIRHHLNDFLLNFGGHIGYSISVSERQKNYGKTMLTMALEECKRLNINNVLIIADEDNSASNRTIQSCGGLLENKVNDGSEILNRYWIRL